jgi:hypothetical protein
MITDKDASSLPFFLYFLIAFGCIRALKILVDMKQHKKYKDETKDPRLDDLFSHEEFEASQ